MKIVAIAVKGKEFLYRASSAHRITSGKAENIAELLNEYKYKLKDGEIWYVFDADEYSVSYGYALNQSFSLRSGALKERH